MMGIKYKCFQFEENSLFEKPIGVAYQKRFEYDEKIDNGLNSRTAEIKKIRVRKIKAVIKVDDKIFSEDKYYWLYDESGVVYDYDLYYAVGKISKDDNGSLLMMDNDIYIIDVVIDIPKFKQYS